MHILLDSADAEEKDGSFMQPCKTWDLGPCTLF